MLTRRLMLGALAAAVAAARDQNYPIRRRSRVEKIWQSPDGNPNGLEATPEGLWVGEQITDRAHLLDWKTGKPLVSYETHSSNTSGIAASEKYVFMAANGPAFLRDKRPTDVAKGGRIAKLDIKTGQSVEDYQTPSGGGLHGLLWADGALWVTQFSPNQIVRCDDQVNVFSSFDVPLSRAHGLGWDDGHLWCMFSNDRRILKFDPASGNVIEAVQLDAVTDPDPHGMTFWDGQLWYCDAGIAPGHTDNKSPHSGWICKIHV